MVQLENWFRNVSMLVLVGDPPLMTSPAIGELYKIQSTTV